MASSAAFVALIGLLVASSAVSASASTFTVGDAQGWTTNVDYTTWTRGKTFNVGDKLVFNYPSKVHTVTEVNKSDYDSCSNSNPLNNDDGGSTTVTLTAGTHYYICTISGHCTGGMKLAVTAGSGSGSPTTPSTTPTGASNRLQAISVAAGAAAVLVKLALF